MALFKIFNNIDSGTTALPATYTKGYMYFDATKGLFYIDTAGEGGSTGTRMAVNAWGARKAYADENENCISTTYIKNLNIDDFTLTITKGDNTTSTLTLPGTVYVTTANSGISITDQLIINSGVRNLTSSSNNGAISANINGTISDITITGLNDLAYIATATTNSNSTYLRGDGTWAEVDVTPIEVIKLI